MINGLNLQAISFWFLILMIIYDNLKWYLGQRAKEQEIQ